MTKSLTESTDSQHSYFAPMVDMLSGVIFILIILLASTSLVSREEFAATAVATDEIARINAELELARAKENAILEPRRRAEAALRLLLNEIKVQLENRGFASEVDFDAGRLTLTASRLFVAGRASLDHHGEALASALASAFATEVACLASARIKDLACGRYEGSLLEQALVAYEASGQEGASGLATARALSLLSRIVAENPDLASLKAADEGTLLEHATFASVTTDEQRELHDEQRVILQFYMRAPAAG